MTKRSTGPGAELPVDVRPHESLEERAEREARELEAMADAGEAADHADRDRREGYARYRERAAALQSLVGAFHNTTGRDRRRAVAASAAYQMLPVAARREWNALLSASDRLENGRDGGIVQPAQELARRQAQDLVSWDPAAPEIDVDVSDIPRA